MVLRRGTLFLPRSVFSCPEFHIDARTDAGIRESRVREPCSSALANEISRLGIRWVKRVRSIKHAAKTES